MAMTKTKDIDEYIAGYPKNVQAKLQELRRVIHETYPEAKEKIAYGIPTFTFHGNLVHFGGFKGHIGFFPTASGVETFKEELGAYAVSKGTVHFPLDKSLPLDLITKIVKFRAQQNLDRSKKK